MLLAALAAASILGGNSLSTVNPGRQALIFQSLGQVVVRLDASGYVQARGCDGKLRHMGDLPVQPQLKVHITNDGELDGLVWDASTSVEQRRAFLRIMRAVGYSDWRALQTACVPTPGAPGPDGDTPGGGRLQATDLGPLLGAPIHARTAPP
jgi:hypothetical protein